MIMNKIDGSMIISIHSLRMEGDVPLLPPHFNAFVFQSTPSAWRETSYRWRNVSAVSHFNPLPPHGGRPGNQPFFPFSFSISIHSLRMEGDVFSVQISQNLYAFQSTPSAWRETCCQVVPSCYVVISIHSLRMEGDLFFACGNGDFMDFNPLPPHGGRR